MSNNFFFNILLIYLLKIDNLVKRKARNDKRNLFDGLANEAEDAADKNDTIYTHQLLGKKTNKKTRWHNSL